jgi:EmrB/QacA subfamily drug resistance transporter
MAAVNAQRTFLSTRRGVYTLLLLCAVQFMDIIDSSIMNVALPSIRSDLGFSQQRLQWVLSGYLVTYGGFLLLGGRAADLFGRRRLLVAGTTLFAVCSLAGGLAVNAGMLVGARVAQGVGAALMAPAGLSILTTSFTAGKDRTRALGVWGAVSGVAAAAGVFLGGVLSEGPGWRWVLFVNIPVCALIIAAALRLIPGARPRTRSATSPRRRSATLDVPGAVLVTAGMLLLVYALVRAPEVGWWDRHTIGELGTAAALLAAFAVVERRTRQPLFPFSILRIKGLAAADATQLIAFAGFLSVFYFLTLDMQNVLGYTPIQSGSAYLPVTAGIILAAGISSQLIPRTGTRPIIVAGTLIAAAGMYYLSRLPVHGSYLTDLLPGLVVMSIGLGAVFVTVTTAANSGVPAHQAGLAAGLLNTALQLGSALGLAVFSAIATARTDHLRAAHVAAPQALTAGFARALLAASIALLVASAVALRATHTRGHTAQTLPDPAPDAAGRSVPVPAE